MNAVKPGHVKATWNGSAGPQTTYACLDHADKLRDHAEDRATVFDVTPSERDSASVWCTYCSEEQHG